ncbi:MAG TPA: sialidase family protein [Opitutaceae bacterium]|nr:sialidase family protein [Opitutaceae bacterium]
MKPHPMLLLALILAVFASVSKSQAAPGSTPFPKLAHYERFIAIDNACGWPLVTLMPDGKITCLIWPHPYHGFIEGAAECWVSEDGGVFWKKIGVPVPNLPATNRMNVAGGLAADGTFLAMIGGWDKRLPSTWKPDPTGREIPRDFFAQASTLNPIPALSRDGGVTWQQFSAFDALQKSGQGIVPYGRIAGLKDGSSGVMMYRDEAAFFTTADNGKTWTKRGVLTDGRLHNETAWLQLENGDLFAAARTYGTSIAALQSVNQHVDAFRSTDGGRTWKSEGALTLAMQHPADLTRLPDGRILLTYGVRNDGFWGVHIRIGDATAKVWSAPMTLVDFEGSTDEPNRPAPRRDGGYPSTVALSDGMLVTAYYSKGVASHHRYHVGVVRWKLPDLADAGRALP